MTTAIARLGIERQAPGVSTRQTLFNVFSAKKTAEMTPGVGRETDVMIVKATAVTELNHEQTAQLEPVWGSAPAGNCEGEGAGHASRWGTVLCRTIRSLLPATGRAARGSLTSCSCRRRWPRPSTAPDGLQPTGPEES
jgi:hypothetical protein